jgi:hypothetical protein
MSYVYVLLSLFDALFTKLLNFEGSVWCLLGIKSIRSNIILLRSRTPYLSKTPDLLRRTLEAKTYQL